MYELVSIGFLQDRAQSVAGMGVAWMSLMLVAWNDSFKSWRLRVNCFTNLIHVESIQTGARNFWLLSTATNCWVAFRLIWGTGFCGCSFGGSSSPASRFCCAGNPPPISPNFFFIWPAHTQKTNGYVGGCRIILVCMSLACRLLATASWLERR